MGARGSDPSFALRPSRMVSGEIPERAKYLSRCGMIGPGAVAHFAARPMKQSERSLLCIESF